MLRQFLTISQKELLEADLAKGRFKLYEKVYLSLFFKKYCLFVQHLLSRIN